MRRFAVVSDVHANLEALDAVLEKVRGLEILCLGDLVDYGAEPDAVIGRLREAGARCIIGNHDAAVLTGDVSRFNARAAMSAVWTGRTLTQESRMYLKGLKEELTLDEEGAALALFHGSPDDRLWEYVDPRTHSDLFGHYLDKIGADVIGLGHTHVPYVWERDGRVVFNPGSVGQPRDGDPRASYALLEIEGGSARVRQIRVEYDIDSAARKILEAGLPRPFAERLAAGR